MKKWIVRENISEEDLKKLESQPELIRNLLFNRGIETAEDAEKFLSPSYEKSLHNPFDILDMGKAVGRIISAIKANEKIVVFGDYDADGVCASVILHEFFKKINYSEIHFHIPDRNLEGYSLSPEAIDEFIEQKAKLIITVDCGIADCAEVKKAQEAGIDVIITDHHLVGEKLPEAFAIVNSKREDDTYPFKYLSGAGVAFKLAQALVEQGKNEPAIGKHFFNGWEKWLLDLVAVATVADMVPLVDENRALVSYGLKVLQKTKRQGLLALYKRLKINPKNVTEGDIAFMIAPRINIASRLDHANTSFFLLTSDCSGDANWIAGQLDGLNKERKSLVQEILDGVENVVKVSDGQEIIFAGNEKWHPGVLGVAANRLLDKYNKPIFLWGTNGESGIFKGSCRASEYHGVNLVDMMKSLPEGILIEAGGHAFAGGFSFNKEKVGDLAEALNEAYKKIASQNDARKEEGDILHIDKEMVIDDVSWGNYELINKLSPFGMDNPKPIFLFSNLEISNVKKFGNGGIHLQLDFKKADGKTISAIGFFNAGLPDSRVDELREGSKIDLVASFEKSTFAGTTQLRLRIEDLKTA
jgi:single-stranded-DNA-specific exonuclease